MPWSETTPMEQRQRFLDDYSSGRFNVTELSELYGIKRKTAYKWIQRFAKHGDEGLKDRSRRPKSSPHQTPEAVQEACWICAGLTRRGGSQAAGRVEQEAS